MRAIPITLYYTKIKHMMKTKPKVGVKFLSKKNKGQKGDDGGRAFASREKKTGSGGLSASVVT